MIEKARTWVTKNPEEFTRFLKFATVGVIGAVVDFGILYILHTVLKWELVFSNTLSFTCAVLSNFTWNRLWTYPDSRSKPLRTQLGQFFIVNLLGWGLNTGILVLLEPILTTFADTQTLIILSKELAHTVGYNFAKAFATGVVMFWNFFINRLWTYNDV